MRTINKKETENIVLYSNKIELSESNENPDIYIAKFIICDFSLNGNNVALNRDTIEDWYSTLKNKPVVGKIALRNDGEMDFTGHNAYLVTKVDDDGEEYEDLEFDTSAFGTFTDVSIEEIDGIEYIVAKAEIWKRFTNACQVIKDRMADGGIATSWEVSVLNSTKKLLNGKIVKIINDGRFLGHCLLSKYTEPAYGCSGMLEIASRDNSNELAESLTKDILEMSSNDKDVEIDRKEEGKMSKNTKIEKSTENQETEVIEVNQTKETEQTEEVAENTEDVGIDNNEQTEVSALTTEDIHRKLDSVIKEGYVCLVFPETSTFWTKSYHSNALDYFEYSYSIENDEISISKPKAITLIASPREFASLISTKDEALISANSQIDTLKAELSELKEYKEKYDTYIAEKEQLEHETKVSELKDYVISSNCFTKEEVESEEISTLISELNEVKIKSLIADKVVEKMKNNEQVSKKETSESKVETKVELTNELEQGKLDSGKLISSVRAFLR